MSSPPPPGGLPDILLPPGMTFDQFMDLQSHLVKIAIAGSVAGGVVFWDYFVLLPDEISLYLAKDRSIWKTPAAWWFIILRYSGIVATLPSLFFLAAQTDFCQTAISASAVGAALASISNGAIFWHRVRELWNGSLMVSLITGFFYIALCACWIASLTQFRGDTGPHTPFLSNCLLHPVARWAPMSYGSSVAFDICVLIFTLAKFRGNFRIAKSKIGQQVYNDNLFYFIVQMATNAVVFSIDAQQSPKFTFIIPAVVPFTTVITVTMGTRVFLNLRLFMQRQKQSSKPYPIPLSFQGQSNPSSSMTSSPRMYHQHGYTYNGQHKISALLTAHSDFEK